MQLKLKANMVSLRVVNCKYDLKRKFGLHWLKKKQIDFSYFKDILP